LNTENSKHLARCSSKAVCGVAKRRRAERS